MRRGTTTLLIVGAVIGVAIVVSKACSPGGATGPASADSSAKQGKVASGRKPGAKGSKKSEAPAVTPVGSAIEPAHGEAGAGRVVFFSPWGGSTKDQLGRDRPAEGNPTAPMSLGRDGAGRLYVLDQVNGRVVRHGADGKVDATSDMKLLAADDLSVGKDGSMAVLDRLSSKAVALYDQGGALLGELPLEGEGVEETGLVTGVFVDGKDVYVEREHGPLVKIGDTSGKPAEPRTEIPGRPTRDGLSFINAGIINAAAGRAYVSSIERATSEHRFTRELKLASTIQSIVLLDSDMQGTIYFAAQVMEEPGGPMILLSCLEPLKGVPVGGAVLPANTLPEETFRDLTVLDEGGVILALRSEQGVSYQRYDCN